MYYFFKTYKPHFACLKCRKVFKKIAIEDYLKQTGRDLVYRELSLVPLEKGYEMLKKNWE